MADAVQLFDDLHLDEDFEHAATLIRESTWAMRLPQDDLLKLYALYKQSTEFNKRGDKPGFFDFKGKAKYEAWEELKDMPQRDAMQSYIDLVHDLNVKYGDGAAAAAAEAELLRHLDDDDHHPALKEDGKEDKDSLGGAPSVSRMVQEEHSLPENASAAERLMFFATAGDIEQMRELIAKDASIDPNWADAHKRT
jgi:diazepam-binding inhibitor (GABA receptor modulating acyl-CoA-binding protein)